MTLGRDSIEGLLVGRRGSVLLVVLGVLVLNGCIQHQYFVRDRAGDTCCLDQGPSRKANTGIFLMLDGLGGQDVAGGRALAGFVTRGRDLSVDVGMGLAMEGTQTALGMSLTGGIRIDHALFGYLYPRVHGDFTNFTIHFADRAWTPRWLVTGNLGFDLPLVQREAVSLSLSPGLALGLTQWDEAYMSGAQEKVRTFEEFYVGGRLALTLVVW